MYDLNSTLGKAGGCDLAAMSVRHDVGPFIRTLYVPSHLIYDLHIYIKAKKEFGSGILIHSCQYIIHV